MLDEPNDMWAVATVLFELLISDYPAWDQQRGPFMFGPNDSDRLEARKLKGPESLAFSRDRIKAEQDLWVGIWFYTRCAH